MTTELDTLEAALRDIHACLLTGDLSRLTSLARKQDEALANVVRARPKGNEAQLNRIRGQSHRNSQLIAAARDGVLDARRILLNPSKHSPSVRTYSLDGRASVISAAPRAVQRQS